MAQWDLYTNAARIRKATEELQIAWQETTEYWSDDVSRTFCENHLEPIGPATKISLDAVARMQQLMKQIQHDCEEEQHYIERNTSFNPPAVGTHAEAARGCQRAR